jgi:tetratricopeptide (TPR) repeat protein
MRRLRKSHTAPSVISMLLTAIFVSPVNALSDEDWDSCSRAGGNSIDLPINSCTAAIDEFERVLEKLVAAYNNRGVAYRSNGETDRAIEDYNQAIHLKSDYYVAINNRGVAHMSKGDLDLAIADYDRVIQIKPSYIAAFYNRAVALSKKGLLEKAIADYDVVIKVDPGNAVFLYQRGMTKLKNGDVIGGESDVRSAESIKPGISGATPIR